MCVFLMFFFFKQKTAYEMRISDWSSDVCSSDLYPQQYRSAPQPSQGGMLFCCHQPLAGAGAAEISRAMWAIRASFALRRANHRYRPLTSTMIVNRSSSTQITFKGVPP